MSIILREVLTIITNYYIISSMFYIETRVANSRVKKRKAGIPK